MVEFLQRNAEQLERAQLPASAQTLAKETAATLRSLAESLSQGTPVQMEDLERRLTVAEEKLFAALLAATPDEALLQVRTEADRDLAPYRRKMTAPQIEQLHKQYVHKRLLDQYRCRAESVLYVRRKNEPRISRRNPDFSNELQSSHFFDALDSLLKI